MITIKDAQGRVKEVRNAAHAFGVIHPFTLASFAAAAGFVLALIIR